MSENELELVKKSVVLLQRLQVLEGILFSDLECLRNWDDEIEAMYHAADDVADVLKAIKEG